MGFLFTSRMSGILPQTQTGKSGGQVHPLAKPARLVLTMRSSREWNVITASLPPLLRWETAPWSIRSTEDSSSLTAIRMA